MAKLLPWEQRMKLGQELVDTTRFADPETGEIYNPAEVPEVDDPEGDEDTFGPTPTEHRVHRPEH